MDNHYQHDNLTFLRKKIQEIRFALFKSEINSVLPLPNNIITTLKTDDEGNVWFLTSCKGSYAKNIDRTFYAYLDYYNKKSDSRLQISGRAAIVEDETEDYIAISQYSKSLSPNLVLVKMKIMQAEYFENRNVEKYSLKDKIKFYINQVFALDAHRIYDFS